MLIWVMPWLIIRALYTLIEVIYSGANKFGIIDSYLGSLEFATVIVSGACWCMVLYGFVKTAADPGPWDWSHLQVQQPQITQSGVQASPPQPGYYTHPTGPNQGWWGQNNNPQQQVYQPYMSPHPQP